jgi:lysozyme family protein
VKEKLASQGNLTSLDRFAPLFERVIGIEDEYVNDPLDPGGETKWGISKRSFPDLDIKNLSRSDAYNIYYLQFWLKIDGDKLRKGIAYQVFDFAVNSGIQTAIRQLQRALGVAEDGFFGPVSRSKLYDTPYYELIINFAAVRIEYMTRLKNWDHDSKGWARRIAQNLRYGVADNND